MSGTITSFSSITGGRIDREKGIIFGVSAITIGQARGHNVFIDSKTLETVREVGNEFEKGIKVKFRHGKSGEFQSVIDETCGVLKNLTIEGNKVRGDFQLLNSLSKERRETIFEMAELMPEQFGFSIVFSGVNEEIGGKKYLRCHELQSIDLTDKPAANPDGLFSMKTIKYESGSAGKHAQDCMCEECGKMEGKDKPKSMEELSAAITGLTELVTKLSERVATANIATSLAYKDADGKVIQLSAADVVTQLQESKKLNEDARKTVENNERKGIITKLSADCRVVKNPETGLAYKLEELEKLELPFLKFAAANSQVLPTQARGAFAGTGGGPRKEFLGWDNKPLTGTALTEAALEEKYGDLEKMLATPAGSTVE